MSISSKISKFETDDADYVVFYILRAFEYTVESLEFVVAQFSLYSWVALSHVLTSSTKTDFERTSYLIEAEHRRIHEMTLSKISTIHEN